MEAEISCHSSVPISFCSEDDGGDDSTNDDANCSIDLGRETILMMVEVTSMVRSTQWLID